MQTTSVAIMQSIRQLQKLRQQQATSVEDPSLLFQQARQQVLRNLRARLHANAITVDPKRAFRRLKQRAASVGNKLASYGVTKARRARSTYEAAYRRVVTSGPGGGTMHEEPTTTATRFATNQQQLHDLMHANPLFRVWRGGCDEQQPFVATPTTTTQTLIVGSVGTVSHVFMRGLTNTTIHNSHHLLQAMHRPPGQALITVSNHVAALDDPLVTAALLPLSSFLSPASMRWTLCATDRCFHNSWMTSFFRAGQVLPVERGAGLEQPGIVAAEDLLRSGSWVHIFPEGTRSRDGKLQPCRKGVGRLVASCSVPPLVVPFVHKGMDSVIAKGSKIPMPGQSVQVEVGPPVQLDDLLALAAAEQWSNDLLYRRIADRIGASMQQLYARLHNVEQQMQMPCIDDDALMPLIEDEMALINRQHTRSQDRWAWKTVSRLHGTTAGKTVGEGNKGLGMSLRSMLASGRSEWQEYCRSRTAWCASMLA